MKNIFMVAAIMLLAVACHRASIPAVTPVTNAEIKNESGQTILAGHASLSTMQWPNYKTWFDNSYNGYTVDTAAAGQLKPLLQNKRIDIFLGSWCGDSRREVPRMLKILQKAGMDTAKVSLIFVDNSTAAYKQSPQHEEKNQYIHHVPSFIIYDDKKEMGRIIESPQISLEKDMLAILQQQPYQPTYKAVDYWRNSVKSRTKKMEDAELRKLAAILKPLCKHSGEFNGYGYVLLAANKPVECLNVFRLNTMIYPDNTGVFDSLGEALAKTGNKKEAATAYEKVLSLKPDDAKAKKKLEELKM